MQKLSGRAFNIICTYICASTCVYIYILVLYNIKNEKKVTPLDRRKKKIVKKIEKKEKLDEKKTPLDEKKTPLDEKKTKP